MTRLSLRLRILLFFALLAIGGVAIVAGALWVGHARMEADRPAGAFINAGLFAGFGLLGLTVGIWLLFDENVAKPIERLAAELRTRAHTDVDRAIDDGAAKYLGDLAPAATALSLKLNESSVSAAEEIAQRTARLQGEREQLTALLSEIPVAVLMVGEDHRIALYDGQAAHALEPIHPLVLGGSLFDHLDETQVRRALEDMATEGARNADLTLSTADGTRVFEAHLRRLGEGAGYMVTLRTEPDASAQRPLVFDFSLSGRAAPESVREARLRDLTFVVFDTETTGLLPDKDEVVQIGAVRCMGGRVIEGEVFDTLVNPGRPIPKTSTAVHGISDDMVATAPPMHEAGERFRRFAQGSVLVAHNAPFDMAFLDRHATATGTRFENPVLDTVLLSAVLFGGSAEHTLDAISDRLQVTIPDVLRHTALGDAEATAAVLLKLLAMLEARGFETFGQVVEECRKHSRILPDLNRD